MFKTKKTPNRAECREIFFKAFSPPMLHMITCGFNVAAIFEMTQSEGSFFMSWKISLS